MIRKLITINSILVIFLSGCLFIYPTLRAFLDIRDPALSEPGTPNAAWRIYRSLTPRYAKWARERIEQGRAANLSTNDISGTEWPLFGSVFYLWAVENLQAAWEAAGHKPGVEPKTFAREAVVAASELVIDPKHASWVKKHWGGDYLHRENVFYRMLIIAALTSREKLLHDRAHMELLRDQVETFATELDATKTGLMDDYPNECYPGDVIAALMCIKRADTVLGTDHSKFLNRALRGFIGTHATRHQLPPYAANSGTGLPASDARGCANSYICLTAPELWPGEAKQWYALYDKFFWQERFTAVGYREFPKDGPHSDWTIDVDAGPVVAGYGVAANAFGLGAARRNGRFDRAYPLAAEMLATVGELPNGVLAAPRLLSNASDAPLLGEAGILWQLTIQPESGFPVRTGGSVPVYVYIILIGVFAFGVWRILESIWTIRELKFTPDPVVRAPAFQIVAWVCLVSGVVYTAWTGHGIIATILLIFAAMLPIKKKTKAPKGAEDWPGADLPHLPKSEPTDEHKS
jgi:hypothetical protein